MGNNWLLDISDVVITC